MRGNGNVDDTILRPLRRRLIMLRTRLRGAAFAFGTMRLIQLLAAAVLITFLLDWFLDLPRSIRAFHASLAIITGALAIHRFIALPLLKKVTDDDLAMLVESRDKTLGSRLISSLQLSRQAEQEDFTDSRQLVNALVRQTARDLDERPLAPVLDRGRLSRTALLAFVAVFAVIGLALLYPDVAQLYTWRNIALREVPWPRKTFLEVLLPKEGENVKISTQGSLTMIRIARGTDLKINVKANGRVPSNVELVYEGVPSADSGQSAIRDRRSLNRIGDRDFTYAFLSLTQSFYFHVVGGDDDDRDPRFWVDVQPTPRVKSIEIERVPPPYTGLEPLVLGQGNIEAPEGSLLRFRIEASMDVEEAAIILGDSAPMTLTREGPRSFLLSHVLTQSLPYSFFLRGTNGLNNRDPLRYSLTSVPDTEPRLQLGLPGVSDLDATPLAVVPVRVTLSDDYGVDSAWLSLKLGKDFPEKVIPFDDEDLIRTRKPGVGAEATAFLLVDLATLLLPVPEDPRPRAVEVGDRIRYLAIARDRHTTAALEPAPNLGATPESRITVVTRLELERKLEELRRRLREEVRKIQKREVQLHELVRSMAPVAALDPGEKEAILDAEVAQNRINGDGKRLLSDLARIFDVHLFNRLEEGSVTEKIISVLFEAYRDATQDPLEGYRTVVKTMPQAGLGDVDQTGKMVEMLEILFRIVETEMPRASDGLKEARSTVDGALRGEVLGRTAQSQGEIITLLERLLDKMEEWEDFQSIVQQARDLIEAQSGIRNRTRQEIQMREIKR